MDEYAEAMDPFHGDDELSDVSESGTRGERDNNHSDDGKFRVRKGGKEKDLPNFRAGAPSAQGMRQADIEANTRTEVFGASGTRLDGEFDPDRRMRDAIGKSENVDQNKPNNSVVIPRAVQEGAPSNAKRKGATPEDAIVIGDDAFNSAKPEENTAATSINLKGAHLKRLQGQEKVVSEAAKKYVKQESVLTSAIGKKGKNIGAIRSLIFAINAKEGGKRARLDVIDR